VNQSACDGEVAVVVCGKVVRDGIHVVDLLGWFLHIYFQCLWLTWIWLHLHLHCSRQIKTALCCMCHSWIWSIRSQEIGFWLCSVEGATNTVGQRIYCSQPWLLYAGSVSSGKYDVVLVVFAFQSDKENLIQGDT